MIGMTYDPHPHPLLDLSPLEQVVLLKAERDQLRCAVVQVGEGLAITHLHELGLIEVQDDAWFPTAARGSLIAHVLARLEHGRVVRRSMTSIEKKTAMAIGVEKELGELMVRVRALPLPIPVL
jgi:hypothetical protein